MCIVKSIFNYVGKKLLLDTNQAKRKSQTMYVTIISGYQKKADICTPFIKRGHIQILKK